MRLVYKRDIVRNTPARWLKQYSRNRDDEKTGWAQRETFGKIRRKLAALDLDTCTAADVDAALGTVWTGNVCDDCERDFPVLVHIGPDPDYDARWQTLCASCVAKAAKLLATAHPHPVAECQSPPPSSSPAKL